jgi:hypothetical protein
MNPELALLFALFRLSCKTDARSDRMPSHRQPERQSRGLISPFSLPFRQPLRLARRSRIALTCFATDDPAHRRIVAQTQSVVHILVAGKATKYRLPEQPGQCVATILAGACVEIIRSLKVGNTRVENVTGSVSPAKGGLLLGQSFLQRFKSWSMNNATHDLVLELP